MFKLLLIEDDISLFDEIQDLGTNVHRHGNLHSFVFDIWTVVRSVFQEGDQGSSLKVRFLTSG